MSADGHNWATSANASDYNEKMWPQDYSPAAGRNRGYDFEGGSSINLSPGGYLWDAAAQAGVSLRDYGEFANNSPVSSATLFPQSQAGTCPGPIAASYTGAALSASWSFEQEDLAPIGQLNDVIWHAVKGPDKPYPAQFDSQPGQAAGDS